MDLKLERMDIDVCFRFQRKIKRSWGANYHALNNLFKISQSRNGNINYEIGVQIIEIYNEQVLDLLITFFITSYQILKFLQLINSIQNPRMQVD